MDPVGRDCAHMVALHRALLTLTRSDQKPSALAELEARGIVFVSLRDNLDLGTPSGRLMFQIIRAMAEFERTPIQERVKAALRHAWSKGKRLGRPTIVVDRSLPATPEKILKALSRAQAPAAVARREQAFRQ